MCRGSMLKSGGRDTPQMSFPITKPPSVSQPLHTRKVLGSCGMHMVADSAETKLVSSGQVRVLGGAGPDPEPRKPQGQSSASFDACHMHTG